MSDSNAVDAAVIARLSEPTLAELMPGGVFVDVSKGAVTQFVIVAMLAHEDSAMFGGTAYERFIYLVKAVEKGTLPSGNVRAASARIHTLLVGTNDNPAPPLSIDGYDHMHTARIERVRITEVDANDNDNRWQHRGGHYEVFVSPN